MADFIADPHQVNIAGRRRLTATGWMIFPNEPYGLHASTFLPLNLAVCAGVPFTRRNIVNSHEAHQATWQNYRSEEHTSELQSLMRISYAVFCLKKKKNNKIKKNPFST